MAINGKKKIYKRKFLESLAEVKRRLKK